MPLRDDLLERAKARVGLVLDGKWRLDSVLGIGGMATVYAATHRNQKRVAIKMLHPEVSVDKQVTTRFTREGYLANTVGHPGTVSVLDDDVAEDGSAFLVMELLEGQTLDSMWERSGTLPVGEVLLLADQLLDVLIAAHSKGILHRDLKPENLFLTSEGQLKVLDFGIARLRELTAGQTSGSTRDGSLLGTPAFMSPEQARGRSQDVDERTDLWAVGATMYTLLSGKFVHEAETINEQLIQTATKPAQPIATLCPDLHVSVARIVDRALAYERNDRWPNARAFQQAVREAMPFVPAATAIIRARQPSGVHSDPTVALAPAAISASTNRSETLTTGRPFSSEVGSFPSGRAPRAWLIAGGLLVLLVGAGTLALRPTSGPTVATQPQGSSADPPQASRPETRPSVGTVSMPPVVGLVAADNVRPTLETPPPAPTEQLAVSAHVDAKSPKPGKPTKTGSKPPAVPSHSPVEPSHPPVVPEPPRSGDLFDKRH
jgi:eukaryotic-like serine/threonine-protein kinase